MTQQPADAMPELLPGFYLATHKDHRPSVCEFCTVTTPPHWRNQSDDRIRFDPREDGYELTPITKGWGAVSAPPSKPTDDGRNK